MAVVVVAVAMVAGRVPVGVVVVVDVRRLDAVVEWCIIQQRYGNRRSLV